MFRDNMFSGGGLEIRTLAGPLTHYRFSKPTPSTAWVILRSDVIITHTFFIIIDFFVAF